jgi:hypothetical protein
MHANTQATGGSRRRRQHTHTVHLSVATNHAHTHTHTHTNTHTRTIDILYFEYGCCNQQKNTQTYKHTHIHTHTDTTVLTSHEPSGLSFDDVINKTHTLCMITQRRCSVHTRIHIHTVHTYTERYTHAHTHTYTSHSITDLAWTLSPISSFCCHSCSKQQWLEINFWP